MGGPYDDIDFEQGLPPDLARKATRRRPVPKKKKKPGQVLHAACIIIIALAGIICSSLLLSGCTAAWLRRFWILIVSVDDQADRTVEIGYYGVCYKTQAQQVICVDHASLTSQAIEDKTGKEAVDWAFDFAKSSVKPIYHMLSLILFIPAAGLGVYTALREYKGDRSKAFAVAFWFSIFSSICALNALTGFTLATGAVVNTDLTGGLDVRSGSLILYLHILQFSLSLGLPVCISPTQSWARLF